jgi:hypothetical protein
LFTLQLIQRYLQETHKSLIIIEFYNPGGQP